MSEAIHTLTAPPDAEPAQVATRKRRALLRERGMATLEYALGVVVVIVIIGVVIAAIQTGTFQDLVKQLIEAIMGWIQEAFKVSLPFGR